MKYLLKALILSSYYCMSLYRKEIGGAISCKIFIPDRGGHEILKRPDR